MGIQGLIPFVKKATTKCHVRKFSGCTVAIDGYCWLYKGAFGCAEKLGKGEPTTAYITYCLKYINVLLAHNVKPIIVLDGRNLISKAHTEKERRERRTKNRKDAKEFLRKGMKKQAWECFTRCIEVTPAMARDFIKTLRDMKIDYIIAPYEADAQLAYLARKNIVDIVITEDSDLMLFGCPKIFFKMSVLGDGVLFDQSKIHSCMAMKVEQFQFERFRWMAMLSGCDYLPSLPGIGLVRAKKIVVGTSGRDFRKILPQIPKLLGLEVEVTEDYIEGFIRAENTFLYQLVFDPITRRLMPLNPYPADIDQKMLDYAGFYVDKKLALDMALGNVDIHTLKKVDNFDPMSHNSGYNDTSMWSPSFKISTTPRMLTVRDMKKGTTHSSTVGMQINVSVGASLKKRPLLEPDADCKNETNDDELISMYSTMDENSPTKAEFHCAVEELNEQTVKRMRLESLEDVTEKTVNFQDEGTLSKKPNPFLKSSSRHVFTKASSSKAVNIKIERKENFPEKVNPLCVIEKNKIYDDDNIIVKSQYFRKMDAFGEEKDRKVKIKGRTVSRKSNFNIGIEVSEEEDDTDDVYLKLKDTQAEIKCETDTRKSNFKIGFEISEGEDETDDVDLKLVENVETSQMTIYSISRDVLSEEQEGSQSQKLSDSELSGSHDQESSPSNLEDEANNHGHPVFTIDDEDDEYSPRRPIKSRLRSSPASSNFGSQKSEDSNSQSKRLLGPCRRVGLSRRGFKNKIDPKQPKLSSMFALQTKPKL